MTRSGVPLRHAKELARVIEAPRAEVGLDQFRLPRCARRDVAAALESFDRVLHATAGESADPDREPRDAGRGALHNSWGKLERALSVQPGLRVFTKPGFGNCQVCERKALNVGKSGLNRQCHCLRRSRLAGCEAGTAALDARERAEHLSQIEKRALAPAALDQRLEDGPGLVALSDEGDGVRDVNRMLGNAPRPQLETTPSRLAHFGHVVLELAQPGASAQNV
ncbi:MAG: hypothetical protein M3P18_13330 [Actinomycetota bacterium]|nr:hypothetical protein [Actinomycetota bacterium]